MPGEHGASLIRTWVASARPGVGSRGRGGGPAGNRLFVRLVLSTVTPTVSHQALGGLESIKHGKSKPWARRSDHPPATPIHTPHGLPIERSPPPRQVIGILCFVPESDHRVQLHQLYYHYGYCSKKLRHKSIELPCFGSRLKMFQRALVLSIHIATPAGLYCGVSSCAIFKGRRTGVW